MILVRRGRRLAAVLAASLLVDATLPAAVPAENQEDPRPRAVDPVAVSPRRAAAAPSAPRTFKTDDARWEDAARVAWAYIEAHTLNRTGLTNATSGYGYVTVWDIGSMIAALHCAHELGLVKDAEYERRMTHLLLTLRDMPLFDGVAFNKTYSVRGTMADRRERTSTRGYGWSAIDLGRLLLWLKIVAGRPAFTQLAGEVAGRVDAARVATNGELVGGSLDATGRLLLHQEGRIGYEQYAAQGYAAWGMRVDHALDVKRHAVPVTVMGQRLLTDARGDDRLTSEPFVLAGLESGWTGEMETLAKAVLAAQEERTRRTKQVTIASEDAIALAPHYFYYYCVWANDRVFQTAAQDAEAPLDGPRWISAKGAFGWDALLPSEFTHRAVAAVARARTARGWASGVYEGNGRSTGAVNVNTQAVILEAAVYRRHGKPFLAR